MYFIGFIVVVAIIVIALASIYNSLIALRNRYKNAFSQIDVQLKRRYDLIPNLVESTKAYLAHERQTLEAVIAARNNASTAHDKAMTNIGKVSEMQALGAAENNLSMAMGRLFALSEAYPDLKANTTIQSLTEELTSTENKVGFARQAYNDAVMTYNTSRESFPAILFATSFGFGTAASFEIIQPVEREAVKVKF